MNILFIGNSYTFYNDLPVLFEQLAKENGKDVTVHSVTKGARKLIAYENAEDPITAKLDALLAEERFDVCIIQEQSVLPIRDFDLFSDGLKCVVSKLDGLADRLILYATWGRKEGSKHLIEFGLTTEQMAHQLNDAYTRAAQQCGADVSPVGMNFLAVHQGHPDIELYNPDCSHPSYQGSCLAALTHYRTVFGQLPEHADCLALSCDELDAFKAALR